MRTLTVIAGILIAIAILSSLSATTALAQTNATQATIVGQVNVNGVPTNGVSVTCGTGSATTSNYNGVDGVYVIAGLPTGTSLPFTATYQGYSYTDTIDPLTAGQQYYEIPAVNIVMETSTPTPTPNATVTPTPAANATVTPTPEANATVTPTPAANATVTPTPEATPTATPTATPVPPTPTPTPEPAPEPAPAQEPASPPVDNTPPADTPEPTPAQSTPTATDVVRDTIAKDPTATASPIGIGTATTQPVPPDLAGPNPTAARSPGFEWVLAIICLAGAAYLVIKKD
ncbi:PGF-CTERM sorting domain-containing protein [Methanocella arvoryzae]|nr:PGF-CTERM sorting domain-containing protein [Methanocella arvoryzae]